MAILLRRCSLLQYVEEHPYCLWWCLLRKPQNQRLVWKWHLFSRWGRGWHEFYTGENLVCLKLAIVTTHDCMKRKWGGHGYLWKLKLLLMSTKKVMWQSSTTAWGRSEVFLLVPIVSPCRHIQNVTSQWGHEWGTSFTFSNTCTLNFVCSPQHQISVFGSPLVDVRVSYFYTGCTWICFRLPA